MSTLEVKNCTTCVFEQVPRESTVCKVCGAAAGAYSQWQRATKPRHEARIDIIGQNGNDGLHYEAAGTPARPLAQQIGGDHYARMAVQPFDYIHRNGLGFAEGCVVKYVSRWRNKNGVEDLRKARHFLDLLIAAEESNG